MASKTLRTSGGDYTDIDTWIAYLQASYSIATPMSGTETLLVQRGQKFGKLGASDINAVYTNGNRILIKADPSDDASLGMPCLSFTASGESNGDLGIYSTADSMRVDFRDILVAIDQGALTVGSTIGNNTVTIESGGLLLKSSNGIQSYVAMESLVLTNSYLKLAYSVIAMWGAVPNDTAHYAFNTNAGVGTRRIDSVNNIFAEYSSIAVSGGILISVSSGFATTSTTQSYSGNLSLVTHTVSNTGNDGGGMGFGTNLILYSTESMDDVIARLKTISLTASQSLLIDTATSVGLDIDAFTDYRGISRPQGSAPDRGPYEYVSYISSDAMYRGIGVGMYTGMR